MAETKTTQAALAGVLSGLFGDSKFSDMMIECEGRKWAVHRAIICTQSEYFMKACEGQFKEARKKAIVLQEDEPDAINALVKFLYKGDYDVEMRRSADWTAPDLHIAVCIAADKYGVTKLAELATTKFRSSIKPDSATFVRVARMLWSTDDKPEALRSAVCEVLQNNKQLMKRGSKSELAQLIRQTPALAAELYFAMAEMSLQPYYSCYQCSTVSPYPDLKVSVLNAYLCPHCGRNIPGQALSAVKFSSSSNPWTKV